MTNKVTTIKDQIYIPSMVKGQMMIDWDTIFISQKMWSITPLLMVWNYLINNIIKNQLLPNTCESLID